MEFSSRTRKGSVKVYCRIISRKPGTFSKIRNCSLSGCNLLIGVFQINNPGDPTVLKKLKSLRCTLQDKLSELKTLDSEIVDLVDESTIEDVSDSCDFASAIQACIVDL